MNERLRRLRKTLGITQQEFAAKIGIKRNTIATYESGRNEPIDAVVSLICREFNVNEEWLRNGKGDMFLDFTEDEFVKAASSLSYDIFVRSLIIEYWKLDDGSKKLFRKFIHKLSDNMRDYEQPNDIGKREATKRVAELTEVPRYVKEDTNYVNAAHALEGATDEEIEHDEDIMDAEDF